MVLLVGLGYSISVDCPVLKTLITGLNMHLINPDLYSKLTTGDCCSTNYNTVNGITCVNGRITQIYLRYLNLNGTISSNTSIPNINGINLMDFSYNSIYGNMPRMGSTMIWYAMHVNQFNGTIGTLGSNMVNYPASAYVQVQNNQLVGTIPSLVKGLNVFLAGNNRLHGKLPVTPISYVVGAIDLSGNFLSGTINSNADIEVYLSNNLFTGALSFNRPTALFIQNNKFTSLTIADTSALGAERCDFTQNSFDIATYNALSATCPLDSPFPPTTLETRSSSRSSLDFSNSATTNVSTYLTTMSNDTTDVLLLDILSTSDFLSESTFSNLSTSLTIGDISVPQRRLYTATHLFYRSLNVSTTLMAVNSTLNESITKNIYNFNANKILYIRLDIYVLLRPAISLLTAVFVMMYTRKLKSKNRKSISFWSYGSRESR
eukprot:NODE_117_length_18329_cov_0.420954.p4 type:complete len:433 gc:universal NODE_117_length_18329_cov_0.420954:4399-3101(-)